MSETITLGALRLEAEQLGSGRDCIFVAIYRPGEQVGHLSLTPEEWLSLRNIDVVMGACDKTISDLRTQLSEALLKCDVLRAELDRAAVEIAKLRREG